MRKRSNINVLKYTDNYVKAVMDILCINTHALGYDYEEEKMVK